MSIGTAPDAVNEAFAGIDRSAVVVIAIVALINTIRRSINWIFEPPFSDWLLATGVSFVESVILCVLVVLAIAWIINRTTPGDRARPRLPRHRAAAHGWTPRRRRRGCERRRGRPDAADDAAAPDRRRLAACGGGTDTKPAIGVDIRPNGDRLLASVTRAPRGSANADAAALANIRERLRCLYGGSASLQVLSTTGGRVEARLDVPLEFAGFRASEGAEAK
jgi:hypothetical protein